jgi:CxxC motif-containing protein
MEERELICICCPLGCPMTVRIDNGAVTVTGNSCARGAEYGEKEVLSPTRVVTSTVKVIDGEFAMVPVKTKTDIPKGKIFDCMKEIQKASVHAPVAIGDVIIENCAGTGVSIVAARNVKRL